MTDIIVKNWAGHVFLHNGYCQRCKINFQHWINCQRECKADEREIKVERGGGRD